MKKRIVLLGIILFFLGCAGQKKSNGNSLKIEYKAYSKGFYQTITAENQIVFVAKTSDDKPVAFKLSVADWNSFKTIVQEMNVQSMPNWNAPSDKRLFDGAASASLKITKEGKTFESQSFDHGNPPSEIKKMITKILSFADLKKKKSE
jgi:hypothetical protein